MTAYAKLTFHADCGDAIDKPIGLVLRKGAPAFDSSLWQRNFYEHIVRDERDLDRCRAYIDANPANWPTDPDQTV